MKNHWLHALIVALIISLTHSTAAGQEASGSATKGAFSPADEAQLRSQLGQLGKAFGVEPEKPAASAPAEQEPTPAPEKKTMAQVADKALDMAGGLVAQVAATLQKVAPSVWRIMIKQQYAKAAGDLIIPFGLIVGMMIINRKYLKGYRDLVAKCDVNCKHDHMSGRVYGYGLPAAAYSIGGLWFLIALSYSIKYLINPEFYAIRDLLIMLLNPSQTPQ